MATISIPYGKTTQAVHVLDDRLNAVLTPAHTDRGEQNEQDIVRAALQAPIGTPSLSELVVGKRHLLIITSDHTRPVPSHITMPLLLQHARQGNPDIRITLLVATGMHRPTTEAELRTKYGDEIVDREEIVVHRAMAEEEMDFFGILPSSGELWLNRLVRECDLVISEGFIEPHFFAGFSGGRKSILRGAEKPDAHDLAVGSWVNVDDKLGAAVLPEKKMTMLRPVKRQVGMADKKSSGYLYCDELVTAYADKQRWYDRGEEIFREAFAVQVGDAQQTRALATTTDKSYVSLIAQKTGAICRNYGIGGTRIARQTIPSENPRKDQDFCSRVLGMDPDADVVVVFGGTNDYGHGDASLGSFADRTPYTFYGALHTLYQSLLSVKRDRYPFCSRVEIERVELHVKYQAQ